MRPSGSFAILTHIGIIENSTSSIRLDPSKSATTTRSLPTIQGPSSRAFLFPDPCWNEIMNLFPPRSLHSTPLVGHQTLPRVASRTSTLIERSANTLTTACGSRPIGATPNLPPIFTLAISDSDSLIISINSSTDSAFGSISERGGQPPGTPHGHTGLDVCGDSVSAPSRELGRCSPSSEGTNLGEGEEREGEGGKTLIATRGPPQYAEALRHWGAVHSSIRPILLPCQDSYALLLLGVKPGGRPSLIPRSHVNQVQVLATAHTEIVNRLQGLGRSSLASRPRGEENRVIPSVSRLKPCAERSRRAGALPSPRLY